MCISTKSVSQAKAWRMHMWSQIKNPLIDPIWLEWKVYIGKVHKFTFHLKIMYVLVIDCCVQPKTWCLQMITSICYHSKFSAWTVLNRIVFLLHMVPTAAVVVQKLETVEITYSGSSSVRDACQLGAHLTFLLESIGFPPRDLFIWPGFPRELTYEI